MNRLILLAIVVCASACDIVGNVPADEGATVTLVQTTCSGRNPQFVVSIKVDAAMDGTDELDLSWGIASNFSSRVLFRPVLDCGWWTGGFEYPSSGGEDDAGFGSGTESQPPISAYCFRGDGPPRQIVTVTGSVTLVGGSSTDSIDANLSADVFSDQTGHSSVSDTPSCAN